MFKGRTNRPRPQLEVLEDRWVPSTAYLRTDLVSDQAGVAQIQDSHLVNAWGISFSPTSPFWVSSNGKNLTTLYAGDVNGNAIQKNSLEVALPDGPTGQVFNSTTSDFMITGGKAFFIFASESGAISAWNPPSGMTAQVPFHAADHAVYKGLALASNNSGNFLYAADFHNGKIDVFDSSFHLTHLAGSFTDANLPKGYAPFNVAALNGKLYVTYAKQDAEGEDDVAGKGNGYIDVFDTDGHLLQRLVSRGQLNSPWGLTVAPSNFGDFSNALLVGNFGDGRINAYNPSTGKFLGTLSQSHNHPIVIAGLWGLTFGNGGMGGDTHTLYFSAGPGDEKHGLFGKITANAAGTNPVKASLSGSIETITGSPESDHVSVMLNRNGDHIIIRAGGRVIDVVPTASVGTVKFNGFAGNDVVVVSSGVTATVILDGGAGNDVLIGGGGSNILLGNAGNDILAGRGHRDLLIGGDGRDILYGNGDDDILIGGRTTHDGNQTELSQILTAWNAADSYTNRVTTIRTGAGGVPKLDSTTVIDDGIRDDLFGAAGLDWFFAGMFDRLHGRLASEQVN